MDSLHQYTGNFAHSPGWWAAYLALTILAVAAMLGGLLLGIARAYAPRTAQEQRPDRTAQLPGRHADGRHPEDTAA